MVSAVFVYGSLLADDVVRALLSRVPPSSPAILPHYHRFSIKGRVYPAIIPAENKEVVGKDSCADKVQVQAYVWQNKMDPNLYGLESVALAYGLLCEYDQGLCARDGAT
ncbi:hypothetical protein ACS0TY_011938 [Phlomoides rotata]